MSDSAYVVMQGEVERLEGEIQRVRTELSQLTERLQAARALSVGIAHHFLLSTAARSLSTKAIQRMSDEEAYSKFREIRWSANNGEPWCPHCGCTKVYSFSDWRTWKCAKCRRKFSTTSNTLFHSRKLSMQDYLTAITIFVNDVKGISAIQLGRDLDVSYKTAFVLAHKLREAMGSQIHNTSELSGVVEVDKVLPC